MNKRVTETEFLAVKNGHQQQIVQAQERLCAVNQADSGLTTDGNVSRRHSTLSVCADTLAGVTSECGLGVDFKFRLVRLPFLNFYAEEMLLK